MLVGPGGVVGLTVALWGVVWCLRAGVGHDWRAHWPPLVAIGSVIVAVCLLSALTEPISLMGHALTAGPEAEEAADHVGAVVGASARGAVLGLGLLLAGALASRLDDPGPDRSADAAEGALAVASAAVLAVAVAAVVLLMPQFASTDPRVWVESRRGFAVAAWFGTSSVALSFALSAATAVRRALRRAA